jgi:hypothetical protein
MAVNPAPTGTPVTQASETAPKAAKFQIFRGRLLQPALLGVSRVTEEQNYY